MSWNRAAPALLGLMVLAVLGDLLLSFDGTIASHRIGDAARYFVFLRGFGYDELRHGNLALWNPYIYSGTPFVGVFQSAMFYPPNLVHLLVPVSVGINFEFAFHVLLIGLGTLAWARGRGLSAPGALVAAGVAAFGATVSLRVLAGALSVLASYAWVPLLLCCVDRLSQRVSLGWMLVATLATSMMLLAGHLPTAFMGAVAVGLYCVPAFVSSSVRWRFAGSLAAMALVALLVAGAQLGAGFAVARESIREGGVSFGFATSYSFPPENLLTLAIPNLFGSATPEGFAYFGRWWYWDDSAFVGVTALVLALVGAVSGRVRGRGSAIALSLAFVLMALGSHTPVYRFLYRWVPGFDLLRAPSKFMFFACLFIALLAGMGMDRLLETDAGGRLDRRRLGAVLAVLGALGLGVGVWTGSGVHAGAGGPPLVHALAALEAPRILRADELSTWGRIAAASLERAGLTCLVLALLLWVSRTWRRATWLILVLCLLDLVSFARQNRGGVPFDVHIARNDFTASVYAEAGERRVLERLQANDFAMAVRGHSLWGYDPVVLGRYAQFIAHTQGRSREDLDNVRGDPPSRFHPLLHLLRGRFSLTSPPFGGMGEVWEHPGELPRFLLVGRAEVRSGTDAVLAALDDERFDPREVVVLESEPEPRPAGGPVHGEVVLRGESTDDMELDVRVDAPAILLVTDSYSSGWRAVPLGGSSQSRYRVQPANLVLRGVALEAGLHHLRLEYAPAAWRLGRAASAAGSLLVLAGAAWWWRQRTRTARAVRTHGGGDGPPRASG